MLERPGNSGGGLLRPAPPNNVRASGEATLARGSRTEHFTVVPATPEEAVPVLRRHMTDVPVTRAYFGARPDVSDEAFRAELEYHPVFRLIPAS